VNDEDLAERMMDLEVKVAYQEKTIAELDQVVRELAARVAVLEARAKGPPPAPESIA
jgi:uncharacterized coiled-coil protein SlyX